MYLASDACYEHQGVALVLDTGQLVPFSTLLLNFKEEK